MGFVDHLKGVKAESRFLEIAFGLHVVEGDLAKSIVTGASPNHVVTIQQMLGDALGKGWKGPKGVWYNGINRPAAKYKFYPGIMSPGNADATQGIDSVFDRDTPHSNAAWIRLECPSGSETGIPDANTKENPPSAFSGIFECQLGEIYDAAGNVVASGQLLTNPADVIAFGCKEIRRYPNSRIDWASLAALRTACDQTYTPDYTTLLPQGVGLTGRYYAGTSFDTLKAKRIDPVIQFDLSSGAPALDLPADNFSVAWEGKIRAKATGTYTFTVTHDDNVTLWVNDTVTPLISNQPAGTHSATISLSAGQFYDIKLHWGDLTGDAQCVLYWTPPGEAQAVIPQDRLYPKNEPLKRFESHLAFTSRTTFDEFLRAVLFTCNGAMQDVDGKLRFFCVDDLAPSFDFDSSNIVANSIQYYPRFSQQEMLNLPNRFIADGRDLESRYLEPFDPPVIHELTDLQAEAGRIIEETVFVGSMPRAQALANLAHYAKIRTAPMVCELQGMPQTFAVLPGDLVTVTHDLMGWTDKNFICHEAIDNSIDNAPDNRKFVLLDWED